VRLDPLMFNKATALECDVLSCYRVIHGIDNVLIFSGISQQCSLLLCVTILRQFLQLFFTDRDIFQDVCELLDFFEPEEFPYNQDNGIFTRRLQYEGELCDPNLLTFASQNKDITVFVALMEAASLSEIFICAGLFTVLAPSNKAFNALEPHLAEELLRLKNTIPHSSWSRAINGPGEGFIRTEQRSMCRSILMHLIKRQQSRSISLHVMEFCM
jgi:hypothetical protein